MDSFEHIIASILEKNGFWTLTCLKVSLTSEEKAAIGRPSCPRWELDVVGYQGKTNRLLVLECKSYIDSYGVRVKTFARQNATDEKRYKLFFDPKLRKVVLRRLALQLVESQFCARDPEITLGLAAGKIYGDQEWLKNHFKDQSWELWTPTFIRKQLIELGNADAQYENTVASVVAKLILRDANNKQE